MREQIADALMRMMRKRTRAFDAGELGRSALVLAPHPDDESLACAGTILAKQAAGATIYLAFMTDGSRSHPRVPRAELAQLRRDEALVAAARLGVDKEHVAFLAYEDGALARSVGAAAECVRALIDRWQPAQVFAPCSHDWHADHIATHEVARAAIGAGKAGPPCTAGKAGPPCTAGKAGPPCTAGKARPIELFEYSVYLWRSWPWAPIEDFARGRRTSAMLFATFTSRVTHALDCGANLDRKRAALASHRTQMEHRDGDPTWWTLGDWGQGQFLRRSLSGFEVFRKR